MPYEYTDAQKQKDVADALAAGVPQTYINSFLAQNGGTANGDYNRLQSSFNSNNEGQGQDSMKTGGAWVPNSAYVAPLSAVTGATSRQMPMSNAPQGMTGRSPMQGGYPMPQGYQNIVPMSTIASPYQGSLGQPTTGMPQGTVFPMQQPQMQSQATQGAQAPGNDIAMIRWANGQTAQIPRSQLGYYLAQGAQVIGN